MTLDELRRELAARWRAAFAQGEARGVEQGAAFRANVAARLDDEREEREARIRAEAYAQGREVGLAARAAAAQEAVAADREAVYAWLMRHAPASVYAFRVACEALDEARDKCARCGRNLAVRGAGVVRGHVKCDCRPKLRLA